MKNAVRAVFVLFFSILGIVQVNAAENELKVYYNDVQILFEDVSPRIINGRAMVPMRQTFEAMGKRVTWIPEGRRIQFVDNIPTLITIQIDNHYLERVGSPKERMDVPPMIIEDHTFIPLRIVAETLGKNVAFIEASSSVFITDRVQDGWYKDGVNNIKFKLISNMRSSSFSVSNFRENERHFKVMFVDRQFPGSYIVPSTQQVYKFPSTESVERLINSPPVFSLEQHEFDLYLTEQDEELGFYSGVVNFYIRREYEYKIFYRILIDNDYIYYSVFLGDETRTNFSEDEVRECLMSTSSFSL